MTKYTEKNGITTKTEYTESDAIGGNSDRIYEKDNYILSYNLTVGYLGLIKVCD